MYSDKVIEHFTNPRNVGELEDADGVGEVGNAACGDIMKMWIKVDDKGVITRATFKTFGCGAAIATSSMATEMITGKPIDEALKLSNRAIAEALDGLPPAKMHCSVLAADALRKAIDSYRGVRTDADAADEVICHCKGITRATIEHAVLHGAQTLGELIDRTEAGTECGGCIPELKEILARFVPPPSSTSKPMAETAAS